MERAILLLLCIITLGSCQNKKETIIETQASYPFYVGTYTDGDSEGIYKYRLDKDGSLNRVGLVATTENPSYLALSHDKKFLLAVNEISVEGASGTVSSFTIHDDGLTAINKSSSGGAHPCFVAVNKSGYVLTANYTSGNIGLLQLNEKGVLSDLLDVQQHTGKGTTERQTSPHAHSAWFEPNGNNIIAIDLGTNEVWFSKLDTIQQKLSPSNPNKIAMAAGAGPRHLTFHPNKKWVYVINELDGTIGLLEKKEDGSYENKTVVSTLPASYKDANTCADIHISKDGKFVYASNRGHNSIAIFAVNSLNGSLKLLGHEPTLGNGPRNFALSPDGAFLVVANQLTNNMVAFERDQKTGLLKFKDQIEAPAPVCILFP